MFPSPTLTPPLLDLYECWYRGVTFGGLDPDSNSQIVSLTGIDGITISGGDTQRALDSGMFAGMDIGGGRDITVQMVVRSALLAGVPPSGVAQIAAARAALAGARQEL